MTRKLLLTQICPIEFTTDACVLVGCEHCNEKLNELLDEYDKQIRAEVIDSINDNIHEIYKCQFYCMEDMCEHDSPTVDMCIKCFYDAIQKILEQLKEQK